jgi:hypothetical protein
VGPCLRLTRVVALIGALALVSAFFMPWFSSQGLLLSGQFLHTFLAGASAADLRRFLPSTPAQQVQVLRVLVDLFPVCGGIGAIAAVVGGVVVPLRVLSNALLGLCGLVPLLAWAGGVTQLPVGAGPEIGLWLIVLGSLAMLLGLAADVRPFSPRA